MFVVPKLNLVKLDRTNPEFMPKLSDRLRETLQRRHLEYPNTARDKNIINEKDSGPLVRAIERMQLNLNIIKTERERPSIPKQAKYLHEVYGLNSSGKKRNNSSRSKVSPKQNKPRKFSQLDHNKENICKNKLSPYKMKIIENIKETRKLKAIAFQDLLKGLFDTLKHTKLLIWYYKTKGPKAVHVKSLKKAVETMVNICQKSLIKRTIIKF